jgi:hypothetical protein
MVMIYRFLACFFAACLLLLSATPQTGEAQPPREKTIWNYDGGIVLVTDGSLADGPCFRMTGRVTAGQFFDNLRRVNTRDGTLYRRGNEVVTEFPEQMQLRFELYDRLCQDRMQQAGSRMYLNKAIMRSLQVNFFWKRGITLRPAPEVLLKKKEAWPLEPDATEIAAELPPRYEWWYEYDVPSAGVPLTDSLVIILNSPDGKIVARVAARM